MLLYDCPRNNQPHPWLDFRPAFWNRKHAMDCKFGQKTVGDSTTKVLLNKHVVKVICVCTSKLVQLLTLVKEASFTNEQ